MDYSTRRKVGLTRSRRSALSLAEIDGPDSMAIGEFSVSPTFRHQESMQSKVCVGTKPNHLSYRAGRRPSILDTPPLSPTALEQKFGPKVQSAKSPAFPQGRFDCADNQPHAMAPRQQTPTTLPIRSSSVKKRQLQMIAQCLDFDALYYNPEYMVVHIANKLRIKKLDSKTRSKILCAIKTVVKCPSTR